MAAPDGEGYLHSLVAGLGAVLMALGTWAYNFIHKRIDGISDAGIRKDTFEEHMKSDEKTMAAINAEITTQRQNVAKLFDKIEELGDKTETRFTVNEKTAVDRHIELLNAIHNIKPK